LDAANEIIRDGVFGEFADETIRKDEIFERGVGHFQDPQD
jgi:hypothetical protein